MENYNFSKKQKLEQKVMKFTVTQPYEEEVSSANRQDYKTQKNEYKIIRQPHSSSSNRSLIKKNLIRVQQKQSTCYPILQRSDISQRTIKLVDNHNEIKQKEQDHYWLQKNIKTSEQKLFNAHEIIKNQQKQIKELRQKISKLEKKNDAQAQNANKINKNQQNLQSFNRQTNQQQIILHNLMNKIQKMSEQLIYFINLSKQYKNQIIKINGVAKQKEKQCELLKQENRKQFDKMKQLEHRLLQIEQLNKRYEQREINYEKKLQEIQYEKKYQEECFLSKQLTLIHQINQYKEQYDLLKKNHVIMESQFRKQSSSQKYPQQSFLQQQYTLLTQKYNKLYESYKSLYQQYINQSESKDFIEQINQSNEENQYNRSNVMVDIGEILRNKESEFANRQLAENCNSQKTKRCNIGNDNFGNYNLTMRKQIFSSKKCNNKENKENKGSSRNGQQIQQSQNQKTRKINLQQLIQDSIKKDKYKQKLSLGKNNRI